MKRSDRFSLLTAGVLFVSPMIMPISASQQESKLDRPSAYIDFSLPQKHEAGRFTLYERNGEAGCREATAEEVETLRRDPGTKLHTISHIDPHLLNEAEPGLKIVLRATLQLEGFPEAKAAFLKSAAIWENKIASPVTVAIDVDFGPTYFGHAWPRFSLGNSNAQELSSANVYGAVRASLIAGATNQQQLAIYNGLPIGSIPTDLGNTTTMQGPSANARVLGLLDPVADPDGREKDIGNAPEVAFNSNYNFDFDPGNGIDPDRIDFEAVAVHEIGHVLGFISKTGARELDKNAPIAPSVWDLFRLRPSTSPDQFPIATRVLSSGGEQVFTVADVELPLSTGRPDGSGGDNFQASHWKNDSLINQWYIGIMEVGLPTGARQVMTANDLLAIRMMGYKLKAGIEIAPEIGKISAGIREDALTVTGLAVNIGSDLIEARIKILDDSGNTLAAYPPAPFDPHELSIAGFTVEFSGINQWRSATQASVTLFDRFGNHSASLRTGILAGDSGGPSLVSVSFDGGVLRIKGKRLSEPLRLEVNGEPVSIPNVTFKGAKKVQIEATAEDLQLRSGSNRVRVIDNNGLRSSALILHL